MAQTWDSGKTRQPGQCVVAGVGAWRARCPFCHKPMGDAPGTAVFCPRCGRGVMRHSQHGSGSEFDGWLPRTISHFQVRTAVTVRRADLLSAAINSQSGAAVELQMVQVEGDCNGPWHAVFNRSVAGVGAIAQGMDGQLLWVAVPPGRAGLLPDWTSLIAPQTVAPATPPRTAPVQAPPKQSAAPAYRPPTKKKGGFGWVIALVAIGMIWYRTHEQRPGVSSFTYNTKPFVPTLPPSPELYDSDYNDAILSLQTGRYDTAIAKFQKYNLIHPGVAGSYEYLGNAYRDKGDLAAADRAYTDALRLKPGDAHTLGNRGLLRQKQNNLPAAIRDYQTALGRDSSQEWIRQNLRAATDEQARAQQKADPKSPESASAIWGQATAAFNVSNYDEAIRLYDEYLAIYPQNSTAFSGLGSAYYNRGTRNHSTADLRTSDMMCARALNIDPRNVLAIGVRGMIRENDGNVSEAIRLYDSALQIDPKAQWIATRRDAIARRGK